MGPEIFVKSPENRNSHNLKRNVNTLETENLGRKKTRNFRNVHQLHDLKPKRRPCLPIFFLEETVLKKRSRNNCTVRPQLHQIVSTPHVLLSFVASKRENLGFEAF